MFFQELLVNDETKKHLTPLPVSTLTKLPTLACLQTLPTTGNSLRQLANKSDLVIYPVSSEYQDEQLQIWQVIAVLNTIKVHFSEVDGPSTEFY